MRTHAFVLAVLGTLTLITGCGGGSPTDGGNGGGDAPFTASINGQAWTADELTLQVTLAGSVDFPGSLTISGTQVQSGSNYRSVILALGFIPGTGTFPLGVNQGTTPGGSGSVVVVAGSSFTNYATPFSGNAGSVTVTSLTGSRMAGTFTFTAPPSLGAGASASVTNGEFDIELPAGFVAATGNSRGSTMTATIGGQPWVGATIVPVGQTGIFVVGGQNTELSVSVTPTLPVTPGIYPIGNGTAGITIHIIDLQTADSWGPAQGSTGTVTFTSTGGGRISGTFAGILGKVGGGSTLTANGAFDVRAPGT